MEASSPAPPKIHTPSKDADEAVADISTPINCRSFSWASHVPAVHLPGWPRFGHPRRREEPMSPYRLERGPPPLPDTPLSQGPIDRASLSTILPPRPNPSDKLSTDFYVTMNNVNDDDMPLLTPIEGYTIAKVPLAGLSRNDTDAANDEFCDMCLFDGNDGQALPLLNLDDCDDDSSEDEQPIRPKPLPRLKMLLARDTIELHL